MGRRKLLLRSLARGAGITGPLRRGRERRVGPNHRISLQRRKALRDVGAVPKFLARIRAKAHAARYQRSAAVRATRSRACTDLVEFIAGVALAAAAIGAFSYAFLVAWRVLA